MSRTVRGRGSYIILGGGLAVALVLGLFWFQPWRLFTRTTVHEALPVVTANGGPTSTPVSDLTQHRRSSPPSPTGPAPSSTGPEPYSTEPRVLATGELITHEHPTTGSVRILKLADGSRVLRLEDLDTSDGPDLHVWLTDATVIDGTRGWRVFDDGEFVDLGPLKATSGDQNYRLPPDLDLEQLRSVSIWCVRFSVSFGAAELA